MKTLQELKDRSIHFKGTIKVTWPQYGDKKEDLEMSDIESKFNGAFCTNNSTICFVDNEEIFVTPYTRDAMRILEAAGFKRRSFYVPFSNWDYPELEKEKWLRLRDLATESYYRDYEVDSARWCDEHGISELSKKTMDHCFRMPRSGVPVKHLYFEDTYYPACNESCVDCTVVDRLGRYCTNNGKVVFVYHDGHTYVAKGYWILDELRNAGYRESGLFVPFSNGEQITDRELAAKWDHLIPRNR